MRYSLLVAAILCLLSFQLLGCGEETDSLTTEVAETEGPVTEISTETSPAVPIPLTPEAVFERLWNAFGGRFEGNEDNFRRLREVTTSQTYLAYLAAAFPTEEPVQSLEAYFQVAPPDPEKYTPFLLELVGVATEEDILFTHWFISKQRESSFMLSNLIIDRGQGAHRGKAGVEADIDRLSLVLTTAIVPAEGPAAAEFKRRHNLADSAWAVRMRDFNEPIMREDAAWLQEQMETHGTDTGLVWSAIYRPALIGEILSNFNSLRNLEDGWIEIHTAPKPDIEELIKQR